MILSLRNYLQSPLWRNKKPLQGFDLQKKDIINLWLHLLRKLRRLPLTLRVVLLFRSFVPLQRPVSFLCSKLIFRMSRPTVTLLIWQYDARLECERKGFRLSFPRNLLLHLAPNYGIQWPARLVRSMKRHFLQRGDVRQLSWRSTGWWWRGMQDTSLMNGIFCPSEPSVARINMQTVTGTDNR